MTVSLEMAADLIASCPNVQQLTIREWNRPRRLSEDVLAQILKLEKLKTLRVCLNGIKSIKKVISTFVDCIHHLTPFSTDSEWMPTTGMSALVADSVRYQKYHRLHCRNQSIEIT